MVVTLCSTPLSSTSSEFVKEWNFDHSFLTATVIALLSLLLVLLGFRSIGSVGVCSSDNVQGNIGDQVEQENTDLVQRHPRVVHSVKLLTRQAKPLAMPSLHPIVCEQEAQPPPE